MDIPFLTFFGFSAVVIVTPGPDTALTVRNALLGGRRGGILTALGVSVGQIVWSVATSLGLVALLLTFEPIYQALKLFGAAYLVFLGLQSLRSAYRGDRLHGIKPKSGTRAPLGSLKAFRQGVINNLANPKMAVFFASVLPQFAPTGHGMLSALILLGCVFSGLTFVWLTFYSVIIDRAGQFVLGSRVGQVIDGSAGMVLIALGLKVAAELR